MDQRQANEYDKLKCTLSLSVSCLFRHNSYFYIGSMNKIICLFCLLPFTLFGQKADTAVNHRWRFVPEGFAEAGYANELWVITDRASGGFSSITYKGNGFYLGGGLKTKESPANPFSYGLSVDYLQYEMDKTLSNNEHTQTSYSYAKISPAVYLLLKKRPLISYRAAGVASYLAPLSNNTKGYYQLGLRLSAEYKAYELCAGFNYGAGKSSPAADIVTNGWHEQMFTFGAVCYPYRLLPKPAPVPHVLSTGGEKK